MAIQAYDTFQSDPVLRDIAERREKFLLDVASAQHSSYREGEEKGLKKGFVKGRAEGRVEGRVEGRAEGRAEEAITDLLLLIEWLVAPPTEALQTRIGRMTDINQIKTLYSLVGKHQLISLEEVAQYLAQH